MGGLSSQTGGLKDRKIDRIIDRQIDRQIDQQTDRLADRQRDRKTNEQIDRRIIDFTSLANFIVAKCKHPYLYKRYYQMIKHLVTWQ